MSKKFRFLGSILILAALLSGALASSFAQDETEIVWWQLQHNDLQAEAFAQIIADFEAANPGVKITMETRDIDPQKEALRVAAGTDAFPDIYFMWSGLGLGGEFVDAGMSAPLDDYYASYGWDELLSPPAVAAAQQYGDHYHGVMSEIHGQVVYYRKDLFEAADITEEPTTYEELIAANEKLVAIGVAPIQFGGTVNWHLMRLLDNLLETTCGVETHDALKALKVSWAETPCVTDAFNELALWSDKYIVEGFEGLDNSESTQLMYAGIAAMALEGDWMNAALIADGQDLDNYGIFLFPTGTGRLYSFAQGNYIGANSENKDVAAAFLDYFSSTDVQQQYLGVFGSISVNQEVVTPEDAPDLDKEWSTIFADATGSFQNADQAFPLEITTEYWRIMNLVSIGDLDPNNAGAEFQKFIDNL
ncbi:MAG TPA: extracellular solute-binding protein [Aggregatilinea sp.]|uniref:ABC transporter substrate-binding protein n=1 Tax=Aggregatilinea sp. TaxID=2806333 RepID=UPI002CAED306|nr:extracellular solute-binding protein [Aggregatilinea sp.]HML20904.1 extracellular solute-binding protein [Aggregatilinea sp.]